MDKISFYGKVFLGLASQISRIEETLDAMSKINKRSSLVQNPKMQRVVGGICQTIQSWLDIHKKEFGLARVVVDYYPLDGSIFIKFEGKFGRGKWPAVVEHWRNGGKEQLQPHLRQLGSEWIHCRVVARYGQSASDIRCFRLKPDRRLVAA